MIIISFFISLHFYLITNTNNNEPECVRSREYVHVKARSDGRQTLVLTEQRLPIMCRGASEISRSKAQKTLDEWTTQDGSSHIDLEAHIDGKRLRPMLAEEIKMARVRRGFSTTKDREELKTQTTMKQFYPLMTKNLSPIALEELHQTMLAAVNR